MAIPKSKSTIKTISYSIYSDRKCIMCVTERGYIHIFIALSEDEFKRYPFIKATSTIFIDINYIDRLLPMNVIDAIDDDFDIDDVGGWIGMIGINTEDYIADKYYAVQNSVLIDTSLTNQGYTCDDNGDIKMTEHNCYNVMHSFIDNMDIALNTKTTILTEADIAEHRRKYKYDE